MDYTGSFEACHINTWLVSSSLPEYSVCTVKNNTMAMEKWMNMTRNPRKSYPRISSIMIAKKDSDAKGVLVTINKNSSSHSRKNNGEDGGGDDDDDNDVDIIIIIIIIIIMPLLSVNTRMSNVTITD